jgi:hypothetical protein
MKILGTTQDFAKERGSQGPGAASIWRNVPKSFHVGRRTFKSKDISVVWVGCLKIDQFRSYFKFQTNGLGGVASYCLRLEHCSSAGQHTHLCMQLLGFIVQVINSRGPLWHQRRNARKDNAVHKRMSRRGQGKSSPRLDWLCWDVHLGRIIVITRLILSIMFTESMISCVLNSLEPRIFCLDSCDAL